MSLTRQLARWQEAGLVDGGTVDRILFFESERKRPILLYAFGGLGALAVAIGVLSVIAANWDALGRHAKLGADLLLLSGVAYGVLCSRPAHWRREVFLILYFLLTLASIALIGQTYQLGGEPYQALALWLVLGSPLVLFGRSRILAASWLTALIAAVATAIAKAFDTFEWLNGDTAQVTVVIAAISLGPLFCLSLGTWPAAEQRRPYYTGFFRAVGWLWLIGLTSLAPHVWYLDLDRHPGGPLPLWSLAIPVGVGLFLTWYLPQTLPNATARARIFLPGVLLFATFSSTLPAAVAHGSIPVWGALSFILLWVGWTLVAYQLGHIRWLNFATAVLAIRLVVGYVELFGSLLQTGLGMILGGLVTLGLAWAWVRKSRDFRQIRNGTRENKS